MSASHASHENDGNVSSSNDGNVSRSNDDVEKLLESFGSEYIVKTSLVNLKIARGTFGEISLGLYHDKSDDLKLVAIKTLFQAYDYGRSDLPQLQKHVMNEIIALRKLQSHPNIVTLHALQYYNSSPSTFTESKLSMVFDYCPMDLQATLDWRKQTFQPLLSLEVVLLVCKDMWAAISHCHASDVVHGDVKPGNLLVSPSGRVKLCDFGLAKIIQQHKEQSGNVTAPDAALCTLYYRPPESLLGDTTAKMSADVYSAGCVMAELILGKPLFPGTSVLDQLSLIFSILGTPVSNGNRNKSDLTDESYFVQSCLDYNKLNLSKKQIAKDWKTVMPRLFESEESDTLVDLMTYTIALNPTARMSSQKVYESFTSFVQKKQIHATGNNEPNYCTQVMNALIPTTLQVTPLMLAPTNRNGDDHNGTSEDIKYAVAMRQAIKAAQDRRDETN